MLCLTVRAYFPRKARITKAKNMKCNLGKRQIIFQLLFFSFLFSGIALAQLESKPTPRSEVATPSKFEFLTVNGQAVANAIEPCERSLAECGDERIGLFGYEGLGGPDSDNPKTETFIFRSGKKTIGIFLLTVMNNEDDSVGGERIRIVFEKRQQVALRPSGTTV